MVSQDSIITLLSSIGPPFLQQLRAIPLRCFPLSHRRMAPPSPAAHPAALLLPAAASEAVAAAVLRQSSILWVLSKSIWVLHLVSITFYDRVCVLFYCFVR